MKVIYFLIFTLCFVKTFQNESVGLSDDLSDHYSAEPRGNNQNYKIF